MVDDETVFDKSIFPTYRGPVYFFADTYMRVDEGGAVAAPLTPRPLCRAVARLGHHPGDHRFLEQVWVSVNRFQGKAAVPIEFSCGS